MLSGRIVRALVAHGRLTAVRPLSTSTVRQLGPPVGPTPPPGKYTGTYSQVMPADIDRFYPDLGDRDVVGFGINGQLGYLDIKEFPYPSIRFRENTPEILALREKEKGDWKHLTIEEKRTLYRHDFCQTFAEMMAPTGEWRIEMAGVIFLISIAFWFIMYIHKYVYGPLPRTMTEEWRKDAVENLVRIRAQHLSGVSAMWDYENNKWKD